MVSVEVAPYWNVNLGDFDETGAIATVEVAPYWNVNTVVSTCLNFIPTGRSSTILECKLIYFLHICQILLRRSSTILECKC